MINSSNNVQKDYNQSDYNSIEIMDYDLETDFCIKNLILITVTLEYKGIWKFLITVIRDYNIEIDFCIKNNYWP